MKRFTIKPFALAAIMAIIPGCSVFGIRSGYEQLPYTLIESAAVGSDHIEIRRYPSRLVAEVSSMKDNREAFTALFEYISGKNELGQDVAMTVPVQVDRSSQVVAMTVPVERSATAEDGVRMRFFLPQSFSLKSAPIPKDPRVRVHMIAEQKYAVLSYSGSNSDHAFAEERDKLSSLLVQSRWKPVGPPSFLGYDPPFALPFLRRNEVIIPVEER